MKKIFFGIILFLIFPSSTFAAFPTLTDYWNGNAKLSFEYKLTQESTTWPAGFDAGVHIETSGNNLYLFARKVNWNNKPDYCPFVNETMHTTVSKSTDNGKTWSFPTDVITNTPNTPYECAATDGDAFYNSTENKWHYLFQCLARDGHWNGCHATRNGSDPFGEFVSDTNNPVITSGEIWTKICATSAKDCASLSQNTPVGKIIDEGTFDIFDYQSGNYFVGLHGFDGTNGYRGIAKTTDFQSWESVALALTKNDALTFSTNWDGNGPIGFGAGKIVKNQGYYYQLSEAADKNLGCTAGQKWVWGLFRSQDLNATTWQQFPAVNPFFTVADFPDTDSVPLPCNPAYMGVFTDSSGKTYLHASRPSYDPKLSGIYFYSLIPKLAGNINLISYPAREVVESPTIATLKIVAKNNQPFYIPYIQTNQNLKFVFNSPVNITLNKGQTNEQKASVTTPPYEFTFTNLPKGEYTLDAEDNIGNHDFMERIGIGDIYVAIGDSITEGGGGAMFTNKVSSWLQSPPGEISTNQRNFPQFGPFHQLFESSYLSNLNNLLSDYYHYPIFILNEGYGGYDTSEYLALLETPTWKDRVSGLSPTNFLIHLGVNDAIPQTSVSIVDANMQNILSKLMTDYHVLRKNIFIAKPMYSNTITKSQEYFNSLVNGPNFWNYFRDKPQYYVDTVHPNTAGYVEIAKLWLDTITTTPPDLNKDHKVDIFDYNILVSKFGNPYTIFDYNVLVANFGKSL